VTLGKPAPDAPPRDDARRTAIITGAIFVAFSVLYAVSIGVSKRNLEWTNFIFDADPGRVLGDALRGQNVGVFMRHPLFTLTIGAVARGLQAVAEPRASVLYAVALLSGASVALAFLFFRAVTERLVTALLMTVLYGLAAAAWVLSSIPEAFATSSGMIVAMLLMHRPEFAQPRASPVRFALNATVAALAVGVAVPNIVYAALAFASNLRSAQPTLRRRIGVFILFSVASLAAFALLGAVQRAMFPDRAAQRSVIGAPIVAAINDPYLRFDHTFHVVDVARLVRAFTVDNVVAPKAVVEVVRAPDGPEHMIQYEGRLAPTYLLSVGALLALVVVIVNTGRLREVAGRHIAQLSLAFVVYNVGFHYFYRANGQPFIFTMHALFPVLVLVALAYTTTTWRHREKLLAGTVALVALNNVTLVSFVNRALDRRCTSPAGNVCLAWEPAADSARFSGGVQEFARSADYPFELGRVEFARSRFDGSIPLFRRALAMDENHLLSQLYLGAALIQTNHLNEAIAHLNVSITRNPSNGDLRRLLSTAQERAGGS